MASPVAPALRLRTLGSIELLGLPEAEGKRLASQPKRSALLLYLAIARPYGWHRRDTLLALLWPELDESHARNALSQALHHLRRILGPDAIEGNGPDLLRLNADIIAVDVRLFEQQVSAGHPAEALQWYHDELVRGFHLPEAAGFGHWLETERHRLRALARQAALAIADAAEAEEKHAQAVAALERAIELQPDDEPTVRRLMLRLHRGGDRRGGLRVYDRFVHWMRTELDSAPSAETVGLAARLREEEDQPPGPRPPADLPPVLRPPLPRVRRRAGIGLLLAALVCLLVLTAARQVLHPQPTTHEALILVAPFHVTAGDTTLAFLREGMVDLLAAKLTGTVGARAMDPRRALAAARDARLGVDPLPASVDEVARRLGADLTLTGSVIRNGQAFVIQATLRSMAGGQGPVTARVEGLPDKLPDLIDQLASQLLLGQSREPVPRLSGLVSQPLPALEAYLEGRSAYRRGQYQQAAQAFRSALQSDSAFALAALYYVDAIDWVGSEDAVEARATAWRLRATLAPADQAYLVALLGARFPEAPTTAERLVAWERAAARAPDRAEVWYGLGDVLYHRGAVAGVPAAGTRAMQAFRRAADLDSACAAPLVHLADLALAAGDGAATRAVVVQYLSIDSTSGIAAYFRWYLDQAQGRTSAVVSSASTPADGLFRIAVASQLHGMGVADGRTAAQALVARAVTAAELASARRLRWLIALNTGHLGDFVHYLEEVTPSPASAVLLGQIFGDGDASWSRRFATSPVLYHRFLIALDAVWRGAAVDRATITELQHDLASSGESWTAEARIDLQAITECRDGSPGVTGSLARLDSLIAAGPSQTDWNAYRPLLLARCLEWQGDLPAARTALHRRPIEAWAGLPYLATFMKEEGRLALALGDSSGAAVAWDRYLLLRATADPVLVPERERIRALRDALPRGPVQGPGDRRNLNPG